MSSSFQLTTPDTYQWFYCPGTTRVTVQVLNAAALIGFGQTAGAGTAALYSDDELFTPTQAGLSRICDEIRVRSAVRGRPAVVYITTLTEADG